MNMDRSFYEILGCNKHSTTDEIRKNFQELILQHHPDKSSSKTSSGKFIEIDKAWKVLRDDHLRKMYDAQLRMDASKDELLLFGTFNTNEMERTDCGYTLTCRCGGDYSIGVTDIFDLERCYVECDQCSFHVLVVQSK